jgi:hypothetical protein
MAPTPSPLLKKLHYKAGMRVALVGAPAGYVALMRGAPGVDFAEKLSGAFDFVHGFYSRKADLEKDVPKLGRALKPGALFWLSYPKGGQLATDLHRHILAAAVHPLGFEVVSLVSIDEVWSAMRCRPAGEVGTKRRPT